MFQIFKDGISNLLPNPKDPKPLLPENRKRSFGNADDGGHRAKNPRLDDETADISTNLESPEVAKSLAMPGAFDTAEPVSVSAMANTPARPAPEQNTDRNQSSGGTTSQNARRLIASRSRLPRSTTSPPSAVDLTQWSIETARFPGIDRAIRTPRRTSHNNLDDKNSGLSSADRGRTIAPTAAQVSNGHRQTNFRRTEFVNDMNRRIASTASSRPPSKRSHRRTAGPQPGTRSSILADHLKVGDGKDKGSNTLLSQGDFDRETIANTRSERKIVDGNQEELQIGSNTHIAVAEKEEETQLAEGNDSSARAERSEGDSRRQMGPRPPAGQGHPAQVDHESKESVPSERRKQKDHKPLGKKDVMIKTRVGVHLVPDGCTVIARDGILLMIKTEPTAYMFKQNKAIEKFMAATGCTYPSMDEVEAFKKLLGGSGSRFFTTAYTSSGTQTNKAPTQMDSPEYIAMADEIKKLKEDKAAVPELKKTIERQAKALEEFEKKHLRISEENSRLQKELTSSQQEKNETEGQVSELKKTIEGLKEQIDSLVKAKEASEPIKASTSVPAPAPVPIPAPVAAPVVATEPAATPAAALFPTLSQPPVRTAPQASASNPSSAPIPAQLFASVSVRTPFPPPTPAQVLASASGPTWTPTPVFADTPATQASQVPPDHPFIFSNQQQHANCSNYPQPSFGRIGLRNTSTSEIQQVPTLPLPEPEPMDLCEDKPEEHIQKQPGLGTNRLKYGFDRGTNNSKPVGQVTKPANAGSSFGAASFASRSQSASSAFQNGNTLFKNANVSDPDTPMLDKSLDEIVQGRLSFGDSGYGSNNGDSLFVSDGETEKENTKSRTQPLSASRQAYLLDKAQRQTLAAEAAARQQRGGNPTNEVGCKYFFRHGKCKEGRNCKYSHDAAHWDAKRNRPRYVQHVKPAQQSGPFSGTPASAIGNARLSQPQASGRQQGLGGQQFRTFHDLLQVQQAKRPPGLFGGAPAVANTRPSNAQPPRAQRRPGPFIDDSDSDDDTNGPIDIEKARREQEQQNKARLAAKAALEQLHRNSLNRQRTERAKVLREREETRRQIALEEAAQKLIEEQEAKKAARAKVKKGVRFVPVGPAAQQNQNRRNPNGGNYTSPWYASQGQHQHDPVLAPAPSFPSGRQTSRRGNNGGNRGRNPRQQTNNSDTEMKDLDEDFGFGQANPSVGANVGFRGFGAQPQQGGWRGMDGMDNEEL